jgi:hypothetical protein
LPLIIASIKNQESLGTTATTFTEDIRFGYNVTAFHLNVFALKASATAATVQNLVDKITRVKLNTLNGTPESTIDTDDLFDMNSQIWGIPRYTSVLTSTDNIPHAFGVTVPLSAQPQDPTKNFGMPAGQGVQFVYDTAADVANDFDNYTTDLTVEGLDSSDKPNSLGYLRYQQDSFTASAVGEVRETKIGTAKRLCGVYNFQTTSFNDLAASAAYDVTGIRNQQITSSDQTQFEYKPSRSWSMMKVPQMVDYAAASNLSNVLDDGNFWADFGINNDSAKVGLNIAGNPNVSVKTTAGVAEALRVCPITLV